MSSVNLIERVMDGSSAEEVLDEAIPNALAARKLMRTETPNLYKFLSDRGDLQDFAAMLASAKALDAKKVAKEKDLPQKLIDDLKMIISEL